MTLPELKPQGLWKFFDDLNSIPRPSKKEERVREWVVKLGHDWKFKTQIDEVGNVLIQKPATPGMENRTPIVMQSHLDMVCQKNADTDFNFDEDGIRMYVDGDWVRAQGTTLGADNGIGVATILAVLDSSDIPHPAIDALFTIDEETGMTGALGLKGGFLEGQILLNLDTEDDDEISIGCAGGVDVTSKATYESEVPVKGLKAMKLAFTGGSGGHSGMDIHKGIANANKLMNRLLLVAYDAVDFRIETLEGGGLRNAIPRESHCTIIMDASDCEAFAEVCLSEFEKITAEYRTTDPGLQWSCETFGDASSEVLPEDVQESLLMAIQACPVGIHRMSPDIPNLVQTSNNLARVEVKDGTITLQCLCRSSVDSEKDDHARSISAAFALAGLETDYSGQYPGWTPNPNSSIVAT
ncbi:MAG: beta-Ala-His dipeptidase, partial [Crocinitomicaceae bacterium]|nr:beta-Ala-His dipeptidase [Crocinitomicaceae bacterium]